MYCVMYMYMYMYKQVLVLPHKLLIVFGDLPPKQCQSLLGETSA